MSISDSKDRLFSQDSQFTKLLDVKKKIFIRQSSIFLSRVQSTANSSGSIPDRKTSSMTESEDKPSMFTALLNNENEEEDDNDFYLEAPDKFNPMQRHLC